MSTTCTLLPTEREASSLASIASSLQPRQTSCEDLLNEVLLTFKDPDVYNFLFTREQIQLAYFGNPTLSQSAIVAKVSSTRIESQATVQPSFSDHCSGSVIYTPAFSMGNFNLGFGFHHSVHTSAAEWMQPNGQMVLDCHARYVMDDSMNTFTTVLQAPEADALLIAYKRANSPTNHTRICATFRRKQFLQLLDSNLLTSNKLRGALYQIQAGFEFRRCPYCSGSHKTCCCSVRMSQSKHPFDQEKFHNTMALQLGDFDGTANMSILQEGKRIKVAKVGCHISVQPSKDSGLAGALRRLALKDYAKNIDPMHSLIPVAADAKARTDTSRETRAVSQENVAAFSSLVDDIWHLPVVGSSWTNENETVTKNGNAEEAYVYDDGYNTSDVSSQGKIGGVNESEIEGDSDLFKKMLCSSLLTETSTYADLQSHVSSDGHQGLKLQKRIERPKKTRGRRKMTGEKEQERLVKLEMRKERNRASARKSNQKKKAVNDALKQQLKMGRDRIDYLRLKELELRQENLRLRKILAVG